MVPQWLIEKKREGESLTEEEIRFFINGFTDGSIPDYQMAAMAMAVYFIANVDVETVGRAVLLLGAGRIKTDDIIDHAVVYRASSKRACRSARVIPSSFSIPTTTPSSPRQNR